MIKDAQENVFFSEAFLPSMFASLHLDRSEAKALLSWGDDDDPFAKRRSSFPSFFPLISWPTCSLSQNGQMAGRSTGPASLWWRARLARTLLKCCDFNTNPVCSKVVWVLTKTILLPVGFWDRWSTISTCRSSEQSVQSNSNALEGLVISPRYLIWRTPEGYPIVADFDTNFWPKSVGLWPDKSVNSSH